MVALGGWGLVEIDQEGIRGNSSGVLERSYLDRVQKLEFVHLSNSLNYEMYELYILARVYYALREKLKTIRQSMLCTPI